MHSSPRPAPRKTAQAPTGLPSIAAVEVRGGANPDGKAQLWTETPEAAAILASCAANPPRTVSIERDNARRGCEMDFEGDVYVGARLRKLERLYNTGFSAVDDIRPWSREAVAAFLDQPTPQDAIARAIGLAANNIDHVFAGCNAAQLQELAR